MRSKRTSSSRPQLYLYIVTLVCRCCFGLVHHKSVFDRIDGISFAQSHSCLNSIHFMHDCSLNNLWRTAWESLKRYNFISSYSLHSWSEANLTFESSNYFYVNLYKCYEIWKMRNISLKCYEHCRVWKKNVKNWKFLQVSFKFEKTSHQLETSVHLFSFKKRSLSYVNFRGFAECLIVLTCDIRFEKIRIVFSNCFWREIRR